MASDIQSRRLGKLRPVKERNQRVRRSKTATRQLEKHAQGRLIYSLCHTAGEGGKKKTARLVWVGKVEFSRPEPRLPAAGLCLRKPRARDHPEHAPLTGMLEHCRSPLPGGPPRVLAVLLHSRTHGQAAVLRQPHANPSANFLRANCDLKGADALF